MPSAPPRLCRCGSIIPAGQRCPKCRKAEDTVRGGARQRGYDGAWDKAKAEHLRRYSFCAVCGSTADLDVHHLEPVRLAPHRRLDPSNLQTLCRRCHNRTTHGKAGGGRG